MKPRSYGGKLKRRFGRRALLGKGNASLAVWGGDRSEPAHKLW